MTSGQQLFILILTYKSGKIEKRLQWNHKNVEQSRRVTDMVPLLTENTIQRLMEI